jgi:glycosyltransferase involved in cell wall biosynthesis
MTSTRLSIVIPCYNEEKNLPLLIKRYNQIKTKNSELIIVDNGSVDGSYSLLKKVKSAPIRIVRVKKNTGYGNGIWQGLIKAKGEFICWTHADMQTDLYDAFKAYNLILRQKNQDKCFIKGRRIGRPFFDRLFTFFMSAFETTLLGTVLYDINAQPNLFHKSMLKSIANPPKDFSFDLYFYYMAKKLKYDVIRFPVKFGERIYGKSNWNTDFKGKLKFIRRTIDFTFKLKRQLK